jgi:hypothetical protein
MATPEHFCVSRIGTNFHTNRINMFTKKILLSLAAPFCRIRSGARTIEENNQQLFNQTSELIRIQINTEASFADPDPMHFDTWIRDG